MKKHIILSMLVLTAALSACGAKPSEPVSSVPSVSVSEEVIAETKLGVATLVTEEGETVLLGHEYIAEEDRLDPAEQFDGRTPADGSKAFSLQLSDAPYASVHYTLYSPSLEEISQGEALPTLPEEGGVYLVRADVAWGEEVLRTTEYFFTLNVAHTLEEVTEEETPTPEASKPPVTGANV